MATSTYIKTTKRDYEANMRILNLALLLVQVGNLIVVLSLDLMLMLG